MSETRHAGSCRGDCCDERSMIRCRPYELDEDARELAYLRRRNRELAELLRETQALIDSVEARFGTADRPPVAEATCDMDDAPMGLQAFCGLLEADGTCGPEGPSDEQWSQAMRRHAIHETFGSLIPRDDDDEEWSEDDRIGLGPILPVDDEGLIVIDSLEPEPGGGRCFEGVPTWTFNEHDD